MKRIAALIMNVILASCIFGGCAFWMKGDYLSVTPHAADTDIAGEAVVEVTSYAQLRNALSDMVTNCTPSGVISIKSFSNATVDFYVNSAINDVAENTPIGAYAVDKITYEIGINRGAAVVALEFTYRHGRADILGMQKARNTDEVVAAVTTALKQSDPYVVIYTDNYKAIDFMQLVRDFTNENPDLVMELPQVGVFVYPQMGQERIVELTFSYLTDRDALQEMQERVSEVFTSANLYVKDTTQVKDIYSRLFSFLMERDDYSLETSITPAYSLLQHGVGDSRAFANVYAAMCRQADLDCTVVSGTRDGEPWCWNLVRYRGNYYHVDLLRSSEKGEFLMQNAAEMSGYVWDYSAYPAA